MMICLSVPFRASRIGTLAALLLFAAVPQLSVAAKPAQDIMAGMERLHTGDLGGGVEALESIARARRNDPAAQLYAGVALWWRHIAELGGVRAGEEAISYLERSVELSRAGREGDPFDAGTAFMLLAHLEGARGKVLRAAFNARKGKRLLERSAAENPSDKDVGFTLGAYDYYADKLPKLVKGLRALLFLPGGNARRGIARLAADAKGGGVFGCEASLVLADIYTGPDERRYDLAFDLLDDLVENYPENPFFRAGRAELLLDVGLFREALVDISQARSLVPASDQRLRAAFDYQEARIRDLSFATGSALEMIEPLPDRLREMRVAPETLARVLYTKGEMLEKIGRLDEALVVYRNVAAMPVKGRVSRHAKRKLSMNLALAAPTYRLVQPAVALLRQGDPGEARKLLEDLLVRYPDDSIVHLFLGEACYQAGAIRQAESLLRRASHESGQGKAWVRGWALVRLGDVLTRRGKRGAARLRYREAQKVEHWRRRGVVLYRLAKMASMSVPPEVETKRSSLR